MSQKVRLEQKLQSEDDALGPKIAAVEQRGRPGGPHQNSDSVGVQHGVLSQVHRVVDLVARSRHAGPVKYVVPGERPSSLIKRIADFQLQRRKNTELRCTAP